MPLRWHCRVRFCLAALLAGLHVAGVALAEEPPRRFDTDILGETFGFDDDTPRAVELDELMQGCPRRDCIESIDAPRFVTAARADFMRDDDMVLALVHGGQAKAYATRILVYHEIVNDYVGGTPLAITFCPLCGSGVAVVREIDGEVTEFGVSGVLYNSDLVLYDRASGTLWDQIRATGIVGPHTGARLGLVSLATTTWARWRAAHPDTLVLTPDTGFDRSYEEYPGRYREYERSDRIRFPVSATDTRLYPKTVVHGLEVDGRHVAYTDALLEQVGVYSDRIGGRTVEVRRLDDGSVAAADPETGERFVAIRLFWFAWYAFHPETELRTGS